MGSPNPTKTTITNIPPFRSDLAFPKMSSDMLDRARNYGTEEVVPANSSLFSRGSRDVDMYVVLEGTVEIYSDATGDFHVTLAHLNSGQFTGELDLLNSRRTLVNGCTVTECRLLRIARTELQRLLRAEGDIANLILQSSMWRRLGFLSTTSGGVILYGDRRDAQTIRIQRFLTQNSYPHQVEDSAEEIRQIREGKQLASEDLPVVLLPDQSLLRRPTIRELADQLGLAEDPDPAKQYDLIVVGAGPAGLAAAVYGASEGLSTLVVEGIGPGGQAGTSSKIENYLGFPTGVSGEELAYRAQTQAQKFGARIAVSRDAIALERAEGLLRLTLDGTVIVDGRSIVIATGAQYRKLAAENYERFENRGIQYAATAIEGNLCHDQEVTVVGGGNSAGQAAVFLSSIAKHVHLIVRKKSLSSTMSQYLISRIESSSRITLHTETEVVRLDGEIALETITLRHNPSGTLDTKACRQLYVMIGAEPNTKWLSPLLKLDEKGFILTGDGNGFETSRYATSAPGVFAVGDVRAGSVKRVASAVGEGSVVISDVHRYLANVNTLQPIATGG